jgi:hypothetical protein
MKSGRVRRGYKDPHHDQEVPRTSSKQWSGSGILEGERRDGIFKLRMLDYDKELDQFHRGMLLDRPSQPIHDNVWGIPRGFQTRDKDGNFVIIH